MGRQYRKSAVGRDVAAANDALTEALADLGHDVQRDSTGEYSIGKGFMSSLSSALSSAANEWVSGNIQSVEDAVKALVSDEDEASSWQAAQSLLNSIEVPIGVDVVLVGLSGPSQNQRVTGEGPLAFASSGDQKQQMPPPFSHGRPSRYLRWRRVDASPLHRAMRVNRTKMAQSLHAFHSIALPVAPILPNRLPGAAARQDGQDAPETTGGPGASAGTAPAEAKEEGGSDRYVGVTHAAHDEMGQVRYRLNYRVRTAPESLSTGLRDLVAASVVDAGSTMVRGEDVTKLLRQHSDTAGLTHAVYIMHGGVLGVELATAEDAARFKMSAAPHSHGGGQVHVALSMATGPKVADIRPARLEPNGQLYYLAGGERERQLQQQLMQSAEGGASAADADADRQRLDEAMDETDGKLVVSGVRALPYWYVADAGNGLSASGKGASKPSSAGKWYVQHEEGCPVASWADHVGLSVGEDAENVGAEGSKPGLGGGLDSLAKIKARITSKMQGLARRTLGFGQGGLFSSKGGDKGSYVGFRQQRLMWIDVGAGPASLGALTSTGSAGTWAESSLPRLDLGAWGLVGESQSEELKPHDEVQSVGPGIMVPRGVDPLAAAGAMSAFQGQLAAYVARSSMQLLVPPALPHWRERMLSETTRIMMKRGLVPKAETTQGGAAGAGNKGPDAQMAFLEEALLPFRSAARPLIVRVLVMVDDGGSTDGEDPDGRRGRGGSGAGGSIHSQLAAATPGSRVSLDNQGARRAHSARNQVKRLQRMRNEARRAGANGGGGDSDKLFDWREADVATLLDDWEGMRKSGGLKKEDVADLLAARIGARLRAGLGPLAVDTEDLVMAPASGATPAKSSRDEMMREVKKEVKRSQRGLPAGFSGGVGESQREMRAPSVALASVQTASVLLSKCERCPFLLQHSMRRGLAMTRMAHQGGDQDTASGANAVLLDVDDFARGAASAGLMDEIMLADLPLGSEDGVGGDAGRGGGDSKSYYSGGALSPAVLPIIIIADDHSIRQSGDIRDSEKTALQAQSAVPVVLKASWSEYARAMQLPKENRRLGVQGASQAQQPQPIRTTMAAGTFQGSSIIGVLNADDAVYRDVLGQGLGRTQLMTAFHCHGNPLPLEMGESALGRALVAETLRFGWGVVPTQVSRRLGAYHTTADEAFGVSYAWSASHTPFGPFAPARAAHLASGDESATERVRRSEMSLSFHIVDAAVRNTLLAILRPALAAFDAAVTEARAFHLLDSNSQLASAVAVALGTEDYGEHATGEKNKDSDSTSHSHVVTPRVARHALSPAARLARQFSRERWLAFRRYLTTLRLALAAHSYQQAYQAILGIAKDAALLHGAASTFRRYLAIAEAGTGSSAVPGGGLLVSGKFVAKMAAQASVRSGLALSAPLLQLRQGAILRLCGLEKSNSAQRSSAQRSSEELDEDLWQAWASDKVTGVDGKAQEGDEDDDTPGAAMRRRFVQRRTESIDRYTRQLRLYEGSNQCPSPTGLNWLMATQVRRLEGSDATLAGVLVAPADREALRDADRADSSDLDAMDATTQPVLQRLGAGAFVMRKVVLPWMGLVAAVFVGGLLGMGPCGFVVFACWHDYCRRSRAVQRVARTAREAVLGGGSKLA